MTQVQKISRAPAKAQRLEFVLAHDEPLNHGAYGKIWALVDKTNDDEKTTLTTTKKQKKVIKIYESLPSLELYEDHRIEARIILHASNPRNGWPSILVQGFQTVSLLDDRESGRPKNGFVMERLGKNLKRYVASHFHTYTFEHVQKWMYQLFLGLACLHKSGWVHADLKPANICIVQKTQGKRIKLIDFGMAQRIGSRTDRPLTAVAFRCPERLIAPKSTRIHGSMDMWSAGCILAFLMLGRSDIFGIPDNAHHILQHQGLLPTRSKNESKEDYRERLDEAYVLYRIKAEVIAHAVAPAPGGAPRPFDCRLGDNQKTGMDADMKQRPETAPMDRTIPQRSADRRVSESVSEDLRKRSEQVPKGPHRTGWIRMFHLLQKLLVWDPDARITAMEALQHPFFPASFREIWPMPDSKRLVPISIDADNMEQDKLFSVQATLVHRN